MKIIAFIKVAYRLGFHKNMGIFWTILALILNLYVFGIADEKQALILMTLYTITATWTLNFMASYSDSMKSLIKDKLEL